MCREEEEGGGDLQISPHFSDVQGSRGTLTFDFWDIKANGLYHKHYTTPFL